MRALSSRLIEFDYLLGGCVVLNCAARIAFGKVDRNSITAHHDGELFFCWGLMLDYDGELITLREALAQAAHNLRTRNHGDETEH